MWKMTKQRDRQILLAENGTSQIKYTKQSDSILNVVAPAIISISY